MKNKLIGLGTVILLGYGAIAGVTEYNNQVHLVEKNQKRVLTLLEKLSAEKAVNTGQEIEIYTLEKKVRTLKKKDALRKKSADALKEKLAALQELADDQAAEILKLKK